MPTGGGPAKALSNRELELMVTLAAAGEGIGEGIDGECSS